MLNLKKISLIINFRLKRNQFSQPDLLKKTFDDAAACLNEE